MRKFRSLFFLLLGIFAFHWVYKFFAGAQSVELIMENKFKLLILIFAHLPSLFFDSVAWLVLMTRNKLSVFSAIIITWISQTSSKFIPTGNITGEFVRFYLAKKSGQKFSDASSTVLIDLFIATFTLLLVGIITFVFVFTKEEQSISYNNFTVLLISIILIFSGCLLFFLIIRKRLISFLIKKLPSINILDKQKIINLFKLDIALHKLSFKKKKLLLAIVFRLIGWLAGAFEIYIFLWIIGVDAKIMDVVLIESVTALIRSAVFFIPAGLGVQELAFVIIGEFVGYSEVVSFAIAIGRRLREIMVGIPAILSWIFLFRNKI